MEPASLMSATSQAGHIGFGAGFVEEHQSLGWQFFLKLLPKASLLKEISAILFAGP